MMVKVCGIVNLDDALAAADAGATAIGFVFHPASPRYIAPERAAEIAMRLPSGVLKVGVFVGSASRVPGIDVVQVYDSPPPIDMRAWHACRASDPIPEAIEAEALLIDGARAGEYGGTGRTFAWTAARGLPYHVILAGGLDASNVAEAIRQAQPWGVDASSRLESSPGRKDHAKVRAFVHAAVGAFRQHATA
jgi:phosphoribosylanthranilate isomerase